MSKGKASHIQYAALPYRWRANVGIEVMLITSRDTGRWVIPEGLAGGGTCSAGLRGARGARGGWAGRANGRATARTLSLQETASRRIVGGLLGRGLRARGRAAAQVMAGAQGAGHPLVRVARGCRGGGGARARHHDPQPAKTSDVESSAWKNDQAAGHGCVVDRPLSTPAHNFVSSAMKRANSSGEVTHTSLPASRIGFCTSGCAIVSLMTS